ARRGARGGGRGGKALTRGGERGGGGDSPLAGDEPFRLEAGGELRPVTLRYAQYGEMSRRRDNVILVCHALSGSARAAEWWGAMFAPGRPLDPARHCVLRVNVLGSCYGSTRPRSVNPRPRAPYARGLPPVGIGA